MFFCPIELCPKLAAADVEEAELGWVEAVLAAIVVPVALPEQVVEVSEQVEQVVVDELETALATE
jgi:hypothetical protein